MKNSLFLKRAMNLVSVILLSVIAGVSSASAQEMVKLFRFVLFDGTEVYAARPSGMKEMGLKGVKMSTNVGYVYADQTNATVPIYSMRREVDGKMQYRVVLSGESFESMQKTTSRGPGWTPYPGDGIIGYVSFTKVPGTIGAYGFQQKNVKGDQERFRFEGKELDTWGAMTTMEFKSTPSFFIWKDKPAVQSNFKPLQDIGFREKLYANGNDQSTVNAAAKFGSPSKLLALSCKDAIETSDTYCRFNLGFYVTRNVNDTQQTFVVKAMGGVSPVGNSGTFQSGRLSHDMVLPVKIKKGKSTVTITLEKLPNDQDINPANNSFTVNTFVTTN